MAEIDLEKLPNHIAIIMDGNGRWAAKRFLNKSAGHNAGAQALKKITLYANDLGIKYLSVYAFSTENWKRSKEEIDNLMDLLRNFIQQYINDTKKNNIRICVIGERSRLATDLLEKISYLEELTKDKDGTTLIIALDYGSRDEIKRSIQKICTDVSKRKFDIDDIDEDLISNYLDTSSFPDPDLLIRTSGEMRLSNFLLWQLAYSEFCFIEKLWPDFNEKDLDNIILQYQKRDRRFGGRK